MIGLKEQVLSFIFSFLYGIMISYIYIKCFNFFYSKKKYFCIFNSFLFCFLIIIVFFKMLYIINNGVINIYFILITILSFIIFYKKFTK